MKKSVCACFVLVVFVLLINDAIFAQRNEWVNQVIVVNGGLYESVPNPVDYVTVQSFNPVTQQTTVFGTIYTQSTQDIVVKDNFAYVAAQDSIVKYNIDTYQRIAAIPDSGLSKLYIYNNRLIVTKQWPVKRFFVEVLNTNDLSLIYRTQNISGDCGEAIIAGDSLYVAVNGGFLSTEGKLAVINPYNWKLRREINLGTEAKGILNLYNYNGLIYAICHTPEGTTGIGNITVYDYHLSVFENIPVGVTLGDGYGLKDNLLYANMNHGIGSFNLLTNKIVDTTLIPDPGFINRVSISSAAVDYVNGLLYTNIGNMLTFGRGLIATVAGDSIGSYTTGLNADAIAIDYRTPVGINSYSDTSEFSLYPNPVSNELIVELKNKSLMREIIISNPTGESFCTSFTSSNRLFYVTCSNLPKGLYFLTIKTDKGNSITKFIKD